MNPAPLSHPGPDRLAAYALLLLGPWETAQVRDHLAACSACRALLDTLPEEALASLSATRVPGHAPGEPAATAVLGADHDPGADDASFTLASDGPLPPALADHPR